MYRRSRASAPRRCEQRYGENLPEPRRARHRHQSSPLFSTSSASTHRRRRYWLRSIQQRSGAIAPWCLPNARQFVCLGESSREKCIRHNANPLSGNVGLQGTRDGLCGQGMPGGRMEWRSQVWQAGNRVSIRVSGHGETSFPFEGKGQGGGAATVSSIMPGPQPPCRGGPAASHFSCSRQEK